MNRIVLLGLRLLQGDGVSLVHQMIRDIHSYNEQSTPSYYKWLNLNFFRHTFPCRFFFCSIEENLKVLQCEGVAIPGESRLFDLAILLGISFKERPSLNELIKIFSKEMGNRTHSIFILSEEVKQLQMLKSSIQKNSSCQVSSLITSIETSGEELIRAFDRDRLILENINQINPDVLILQLDDPKAELWLNRVYKRLNTPVIFSIPNRDQKKNKFKESITFFILLCPFIIWYNVHSYFSNPFRRYQTDYYKKNLLFISSKKTFALVHVPQILNEEFCRNFNDSLQEALGQDLVIIDFQPLKKITLEGIRVIFDFYILANKTKKILLTYRIPKKILWLFKSCRIWNGMNHNFSNLKTLTSFLQDIEPISNFYESIEQILATLIITPFGELKISESHISNQKYESMLKDKDCVVDLTYCSDVEISGLVLLLKLRKFQHEQGKKIIICGLSRKQKRVLCNANLIDKFEIFTNRESIFKVEKGMA